MQVNGVEIGRALLSNLRWPFGELVAYTSRGNRVVAGGPRSHRPRPVPSPTACMTHAPGRMAGKVAVVTGAAGGQGAAEAVALATAGARVVAADIAEYPVADAADALAELFGAEPA